MLEQLGVVYELPTSGYPDWTSEQQHAVMNWIDAHGLDHTRVPVNTFATLAVTVDGAGSLWLETWLLVRDEDGHLIRCPTCPGCFRMEQVRVPLAAEIPAGIPGGWFTNQVTVPTPPDTKEEAADHV